MPEYVMELWVRNDKLKRGGGRNSTTFQTTRTNKRAGHTATWTFKCDDVPAATRDIIETAVASLTNPVFVD